MSDFQTKFGWKLQALRTCPVCREPCHFVTPSKVWPRNQREKAAIVKAYKKQLGSIDCKYWLARPEGDRTCPFGTSCFYRHTGAEVISVLCIILQGLVPNIYVPTLLQKWECWHAIGRREDLWLTQWPKNIPTTLPKFQDSVPAIHNNT